MSKRKSESQIQNKDEKSKKHLSRLQLDYPISGVDESSKIIAKNDELDATKHTSEKLRGEDDKDERELTSVPLPLSSSSSSFGMYERKEEDKDVISLYDMCIEKKPDIKKTELSGCFGFDKRDKIPLIEEIIEENGNFKNKETRNIYIAFIDGKQKCSCSPISSPPKRWEDNLNMMKEKRSENCKEVIFKTYPRNTDIKDPFDEIILLDKLNGHPNIVEFYGIYKLPPTDKLKSIFFNSIHPIVCYDTVVVLEKGLGNINNKLKKLKIAFHKKYDKLFGHTQNTELFLFVWIAKDILSGLEHIHKMIYVHLDLKPENICIFQKGRKYVFKIIDLGSCRKIDEEIDDMQGTYTTAPPELLKLEEVTKSEFSCDYYSFGVVLYFIYKGHLPLNSDGKAWRLHLKRYGDTAWLRTGNEIEEKDYSSKAIENRKNDFLNDVEPNYKDEYRDNYSLINELYNIIEGLISVDPSKRYNYIKQFKSLLEKIDVNINPKNQTAKLKFNKKKSKKHKKTSKKNKKRKTRNKRKYKKSKKTKNKRKYKKSNK